MRANGLVAGSRRIRRVGEQASRKCDGVLIAAGTSLRHFVERLVCAGKRRQNDVVFGVLVATLICPRSERWRPGMAWSRSRGAGGPDPGRAGQWASGIGLDFRYWARLDLGSDFLFYFSF